MLGLLTLAMVTFALVAPWRLPAVVALVAMGAFAFGAVPALQMRIMRYAGAAPTLASGSNIAAFNVGNATGAWIGGLTISAGLGYVSTLWAGAAMAGAALLTAVVASRADRLPKCTAELDTAKAHAGATA
ncbi:MFS transporter [Calidifontibacter sp. DB0510]|uniref:MFS transporter n=1 Tax=Metallococcus carri TaxID=1656884 RepID=A0A967B277_9MICO|nr:MFS transporter [Metallococcus carri]NHN56948.1 MFS transporter [Metallococcus carri]NOP37693.1 MFS transporter [Calidifontibacter sp. DB2511S]